MKAPALRILFALAALLACLSCDVSDPSQERNFVSLLVPDSLGKYDDVRILLLKPESADTLDTLWSGPVTESSDLAKLPAKNYTGGMVDVIVQGKMGDSVVYLVLIQYRGAREKPTLLNLPLPEIHPANGGVKDTVPTPAVKDTVPPTITLSGEASPALELNGPLPDLGAACQDEKDGALETKLSGEVDRSKAGRYEILYTCEDKSGNAARPVLRTVWVALPPDSARPIIALRGPDSITVFEREEYVDSGAVCTDDRDTALTVQVEGAVDTRKRGGQILRFHCADAAGNPALEKIRQVLVARLPDTLKPVLSMSGRDSVSVFQGHAYADSGVTCTDERDGELPVAIRGNVDTGLRGDYALAFSCVDSAGNMASEQIRRITVVRPPDADPPVLTLKGADSLTVFQGRSYADPGADCLDARDGSLPVQARGSVDMGVRGIHALEFGCADSAGNAAVPKVRRVMVAREPDSAKPILALRGGDSLTTYDHEPYADSGAECGDARDGARPVSMTGQVDVAVRGLYTLAFHCEDSAGNAAQAFRKVRVVRRPDPVKPLLSLRGPDSLQMIQGAAYADSGAACQDDRDGMLPAAVTGSIDTGLRGIQTLAFHCEDSAGNAADAIRKVNVVRTPDSSKPVISLRGAASIRIFIGEPYADSGADCLDNRDGIRPVTMTGQVDNGIAGEYVLSFHCADSAGNAADAPTRTVTVAPNPDSPPVITLAGEDTIPLVSTASFIDPGGACQDAEDGALTLIRTGISPAGTAPGFYQAGYSCQDAAGNRSTATRTLKVGLFGTYLASTADVQIDTLSEGRNFGATGPVCFVNEPDGSYFTLVRFDMSQAVKSGLKSAKLHLFTFGHGDAWPGTFADYTFQVYREKSDWVEGTGNWFYHFGGLQNGGGTWLQYYPMSAWGKANSTSPSEVTGLMGWNTEVVRQENLDLVATRKLNLFFSDKNGNPNHVPPPNALTVVEIDVTDYVRSADPAADHGIVIKVFGVPEGRYMDFATRDLGDGSWAPRLMLEY